jgi:hypothetical protein
VVSLPPPAGKQLCGTIAAAEGSTGPGGTFRAYVFCTRRDAPETQLLFRFTTDPNGIGGWSAWGAIQLAGGATVTNTGYALAATTVGSMGTNGVDVAARQAPRHAEPPRGDATHLRTSVTMNGGGLVACAAAGERQHCTVLHQQLSTRRLYVAPVIQSCPDGAANWANHDRPPAATSSSRTSGWTPNRPPSSAGERSLPTRAQATTRR